MSVEIVRVTPDVIAHLQGREVGFPVIAYVGLENGHLRGSGGLAWYKGRCWVWLGLMDMQRTRPNVLVRVARRTINTAWQLGENAIFCERDPREPMAERLLTLLNFRYVEDEQVIHDDGSSGELWRALRP